MYRFAVVAILFVTLITNVTTAVAQPIGNVVDPVPIQAPSPLLITAQAMASDRLVFTQIHNNTDESVNLSGWTVRLFAASTTDELEITLANFDSWLVPRGYVVIAHSGDVNGVDIEYSLPAEAYARLQALPQKSVKVVPPENTNIATISLTSTVYIPNWVERNRSTTASAAYLTTFTTKSTFATLSGHGLYNPINHSGGLRIVEILPNPRTCSPLEILIECGDYIKLQNGSDMPVDLSNYRVRTSSGGTKSLAGNTFHISGVLQPKAYMVITTEDNGDKLSITNSGGNVWIEDEFGVNKFDPIINYPDASSTTKTGLSWALDDSDKTWKWMTPAPYGANFWTSEKPEQTNSPTSGLADCGPGRYRNPLTNRCRTVLTATSSLVPCREGQERNPATNRCRSVLGASTQYKPCADNQYRNPETNRCKLISAASSTLKPCNPGQERNPATNRCRKIPVSKSVLGATDIQDIESETQSNTTGWFIAGAAVLLAIGYAIYEWRADIWRKLRSFRSK